MEHNSILAKNEFSWVSVDKGKLPRFAYARKEGTKLDWGYPHHWVKGGKVGGDGIYISGTMYLHKRGLNAAWAAANGSHSGNRASPAVLAHLRKHFSALGIKRAVWEGEEYDVEIFDEELLAVKLLEPSDLQIDPAAYAIRVMGGAE